ncbi:hypothetical protein TWF506_009286 [Arthrobotrys conoides]|uniref:Apple domain-containing protein n=1 Tax=Arthrobotrys conoides TaxID=74498 RepID=A0AAN8RWY5_9PEZI
MGLYITEIWVFLLILLQCSTAAKLEIPYRPRAVTTTTITDITTHYSTYRPFCGSTATAGGESNGGGGTNGGGSNGGGGTNGSGGGGTGTGTGTGGNGAGSINPTGSGSEGGTGTGFTPTATGSGGTTGTGTSPPISITSSPSTTLIATDRFRLVATADDGSLSYVAVNSANFAVVTDSPPPYYYRYDEFGAVRQLAADPKILYGVITSDRRRGFRKSQSRLGYIGGASVVPSGVVGNFRINLVDADADSFEIQMEVSGVLAEFATNCTFGDGGPLEALNIIMGLVPSDLGCVRLRLGGFRPNVNPSTIGSRTGTRGNTGTGTRTSTNTGSPNTRTSPTTCNTPVPENTALECRGSDDSIGHAANGREFLLCQGEARLSSSRLQTIDDVVYPICLLECSKDLQCKGFIYDWPQSKCFLLSEISGIPIINFNYYMGIFKCNDLAPTTTPISSSSTNRGNDGSISSDSSSSSESSSQDSSSSSTSPSVTPVPKCYNFIEENNDWPCDKGATEAISSTVIATTSSTVAYAAAFCYNTDSVSLPESADVTECLNKCIALGPDGCKMFGVDNTGQCSTLASVSAALWDEPQSYVNTLVGGMLCDDFGVTGVCWKPVASTTGYNCPQGYSIFMYSGDGDQVMDVCLPPAFDFQAYTDPLNMCIRQCFYSGTCIGFSINPDQGQPGCGQFTMSAELDVALAIIGDGGVPNFVLAYVRCKDLVSLSTCNLYVGNYAWQRCETFASIVEEELGDGRSVRMCKYENRGISSIYSTISTSTALICAQYCGLLENCDAFNWNKATKECNVGTGLNAATTAQVDMNIISGWTLCSRRTEIACVNANPMASRACDADSTTGFGYAQDDRSFRICTQAQYTGSTLLAQTNLLETVTQCAYYCTVQGTGCTYFTWDSAASICYIYSNFGTLNANAPAGTMIGWTLCDDNKPGVCETDFEANRLATRLCPDNTAVLIQRTTGSGDFGDYRICRDSTLTGELVPGSYPDTSVTLFRSCELLCEQFIQCLFWAMEITDPDDQRGVCNTYIRPGATISRDASDPGVLNIGYPLCVPVEGDTTTDPTCPDPAPYASMRCFGVYGDMVGPGRSTASDGRLYRWCYGQSNTMQAANGVAFPPIRTFTSIPDSNGCVDKCAVIAGCESYIVDYDSQTCALYGAGSMGTAIAKTGFVQGWFICDEEGDPIVCPNFRQATIGFKCGDGQYFERMAAEAFELYILCGPGSAVVNTNLNKINSITIQGATTIEKYTYCAKYCSLTRAASSASNICTFWTLDATETTCTIYTEFGNNQWTDTAGAYSGYPVCDMGYVASCPYPSVPSNGQQICRGGGDESTVVSSNNKREAEQCSGQDHINNSGEILVGDMTLGGCRNACFDDPFCSGYLWKGVSDDGTQKECKHVAIFSDVFGDGSISTEWTVGYITCSQP